jgi:lipoate-protein ligase A
MTINNSNFRFIVSKKSSAKLNMATDEALLKSFEDGDLPILRVYSWNDSFTLGVSQKISDYEYLLKDFSKDYAKRVTGGGVLFHGHDLSYSLILPSSYMQGLSIKESYEKICTFLLNFYKSLGLNAIYAKDDKNIQLSKSPFCQVGFEAYDILANGIKIGGNAQRRTKKVIFQHGSIPLEEKSNDNIQIGSNLKSNFNIDISYEKAISIVKETFEKSFDVKLTQSELNEKEQKCLSNLLKEKYDYTN